MTTSITATDLQRPLDVNEAQLERLMTDDNYAMSQKIDGHRIFIQTDPLVTRTRSGEERDLPPDLRELFASFKGRWVFDGEILDKTFHPFDILVTPKGDIRQWPWETRHMLLLKLKGHFNGSVDIVRNAITTNDKRVLFDKCVANNSEGVVFARRDGVYRKRKTGSLYKFKFVKQVDGFVTAMNVNGKDNFELSVYDGDLVVPIANVSALTGDGPQLEVGSVVTVNALYATKDNRLYQPVKPILRTDKSALDCTIDQLDAIKTNKTVL